MSTHNLQKQIVQNIHIKFHTWDYQETEGETMQGKRREIAMPIHVQHLTIINYWRVRCGSRLDKY